MPKTYPLLPKGKILFILSGIILIFSIIGIPVSLIFFYMAMKAKVVMTDDAITIKVLRKKTIPYKEIEKIEFLRPVSVGHAAVGQLSYVEPLLITWGGTKKTKFSINYFEGSHEIVEILMQKTGKSIGVSNDMKAQRVTFS
ncbi:MAG: hypothetical protein AAB739_05080 [Patescibacteria group bacterium]